ncbi:MAG: hypothetical protein JWM04_1895 [Verrucomicrobiales bacterium]|nr:hypothetical protein [Verrucomicrobiales bacterium]
MTEKSKRNRRVHSVSDELIEKSREAALAAVQIFNNPQITFKSEMFIVLMNIAWTYMLHAYFRKQAVEYRYFEQNGKTRRFGRTAKGAYKYWELERCLNENPCPVDRDSSNNLRFLIGIRHEIEHQMTTKIDSSFSAKFQACCLNYNDHIKGFFGDQHGIDKHLSFSLQFSSITKDQVAQLERQLTLPTHIRSFVEGFETKLTEEEFNSPKFAYRVLFVAKTANRKGQADEVIEFVKAESELAKNVNQKYTIIKETERPKLRPKTIIDTMKKEGFTKFTMHDHTLLWQEKVAKEPSKGLGTTVEGSWYWYEPWLVQVREYCNSNAERFRSSLKLGSTKSMGRWGL